MDDTADHHPGSQDIKEQVETYAFFGGLTKWGSLAIAVVVLMLTMWFCVGSGFMGGLIPGLVLLVLGVLFLRSKPAHDR